MSISIDDWWKLSPQEKWKPPAADPWVGKTLFTAWAPTTAILDRAKSVGVARVAVETTSENQAGWPALREHGDAIGLSLGVWDADCKGSIWVRADFYIAQVESADLVPPYVLPNPYFPKAIVTTLPSLQMQKWADGWAWLTECYQGADPNTTPLKMDFQAHQSGLPPAVPTYPICGVFDGYPLANYTAELPRFPHGFGVYLAEEMSDADWQTLAAL